MAKIITAVASALLLAVIVTELFTRFFTNDYFTLLVVLTVAMLINGLVNARIASHNQPKPVQSDRRQNQSRRGKEQSDRRKQPRQNKGQNDGQKRGRADQKGGHRQQQNKSRNDNTDKQQANKSNDTKQAAKPVASGPTEEGTVKWFNRSKGYGFIVRGNGEEIFVHQRSINSSGNQRPVLQDGQAVRFTVTKQDKGDQAENVTPLD